MNIIINLYKKVNMSLGVMCELQCNHFHLGFDDIFCRFSYLGNRYGRKDLRTILDSGYNI